MMKMRHGEVRDEEWVSLLAKAREMGLTVEEVKSFLTQSHR